MSREAIRFQYPEIYDYLDWLRCITTMSIYRVRVYSDEERIKKHIHLMERYGFKVSKDRLLYEKSKILLDNLDAMLDWTPSDKITISVCSKLEGWLKSEAFQKYMSSEADGIYYRGRLYH